VQALHTRTWKKGLPGVAGALLFALAAYVAIASVASLLGYSEPKPTFLGIAILVAAAAVMPWLAKEKRRLSGATGSAALRADAAQSALCAYLSLIALAGLAINAIWHIKWADSLAAFAILPLIVWRVARLFAGRPAAVASFAASPWFLQGPLRLVGQQKATSKE
jgi:divalent metal cation (Fe/Co/Zn/Cd) transporter